MVGEDKSDQNTIVVNNGKVKVVETNNKCRNCKKRGHDWRGYPFPRAWHIVCTPEAQKYAHCPIYDK